jgi:hypothetical protein
LLRVDVPKLIDDFPIEAFKFKDDIVKVYLKSNKGTCYYNEKTWIKFADS